MYTVVMDDLTGQRGRGGGCSEAEGEDGEGTD